MAIALVQFHLKTPMSREAAAARFEATGQRYLGMTGLIRKSYFRTDAGDLIGAIYEWRSRADGEALYDEAWRTRVAAQYGAEPELTWLETPVVVDNLKGEIIRS